MDERVVEFARRATSAGIFCDFDGTLSEIVDVPSEARPVEGAEAVLARLARVFKVVAIVSGRATEELLDRLGSDIDIWGLHGAERTMNGQVVVAERAAPYIDVMAAIGRHAAQEVAEAGLDGVVIEDKGPMLGLHYRMAADQERARRFLEALAERYVQQHGLMRATGRKVIELRPPLEFSKQQVLLEVARGASLSAVCFIGDDSVDVPAFNAIDELKTQGMHGLKIAVSSDEAPADLLDLADVELAGPRSVVTFLEDLAAAAARTQ